MKWERRIPVGHSKKYKSTLEIHIAQQDVVRILSRLTGRDIGVRAERDAIYIYERTEVDSE